jgi:hypothetical protein
MPDSKTIKRDAALDAVNPALQGAPLPLEYGRDGGVDTRNAEANVASRSNIVRD